MMPSKKKKYNARFPAGRIKKIMQTDEEVGKVAQAVPVIISRTLELFVESLLTKSIQITQARNAKTLTPSHMKQCILSEHRFDFLKDLVKNIPDASAHEDLDNSVCESTDFSTYQSSDHSEPTTPSSDKKNPEIVANFYTEQASTSARTPVIQYSPKIIPVEPATSAPVENAKIDGANAHNFSMGPPVGMPPQENKGKPSSTITSSSEVPPLVPISNNFYPQSDNLLIDEDYDN